MDDLFASANADAIYYAKFTIARLWHRARKVRGLIRLWGFTFPEEDGNWDDPAGVVDFAEAIDEDPEAAFVWIDAERGLRTPSELYWLGYWDSEYIRERNRSGQPYVVTTNDVGALYERFKNMAGIGDTVMPYSCVGGIHSPQEAANLFAGDQLHTMPYRDYLKTEHWQEMRASALDAAGGRCQLCNAEKRLHTHHRTYERRGFEAPGDLIVLCAGCHAKFHDKLPKGGNE